MPNVVEKLNPGIEVKGKLQTSIEVREQTCGDLEDAQELQLQDGKQGSVALNHALLSLVCVKLGDEVGPFPASIFRRASSSNYVAMTKAMDKANDLGKPESSGTATI